MRSIPFAIKKDIIAAVMLSTLAAFSGAMIVPRVTAWRDAPTIFGIKYSDSAYTVVGYVRSQCPYCTQTLPFYSALSHNHGGPKAYRLVIATDESETTLTPYLASHNVLPDRVVIRAPSTVGVSATPTTLVVDRAGRVVERIVGIITPDTQTRLLTLIAKGV